MIPDTNPACPLCFGHQIELRQRLAMKDLSAAYQRKLGIDVQNGIEHLDYLDCLHCGLLFFHPSIAGSDRFYAELQKFPWYYPAGKHEFAIAKRFIKAEHAVLEIGAGSGHFAAAIAVQHYTGLELSDTTSGKARSRGLNVLAESIETHAKSHAGDYDIVCSFQVLEHVSQPREFLQAAKTCVRPGGYLIIGVPGEDSFAAHDYWQILNMPPHHLTRWRDRCLTKVAELIGMESVGLFPEELSESDLMAYATVLAAASFAAKRGRLPRMLDPRLARPIAKFRARQIAKKLVPGLRLAGLRPRGQAVVAVYQRSYTESD